MTKNITIRLLASSIAIQAIGTLSTFALLIIVARVGGPRIQGEFALMRSWVDFAGIAAQFGLPQAFIFVVNKRLASPHQLAVWSAKYSSVAAAIAIIASGITVVFGFVVTSSALFIVAICLGLAVGMLTYHRLIRSLLLTTTDGPSFAVFTIFPTCVLFVAVLVALAASMPLEWAFLASAVAGAGASIWIARNFRPDESPQALPVRILAEQSWLMFLHSALGSAQPLLMFLICTRLGASTQDIGYLSVATISVVAANAVFGMISPILFNRWSKNLTSSRSAAVFRPLLLAALAACGLVIIAVPLTPVLVPLVFGGDFSPAVPLMQIIVLALPPVLFAQVAIPAFFGLGRVKSVIYSSGLRVCVAVLSLGALAAIGLEPIHAAAWAWLIAEWAAAASLLFSSSRLGPQEPTPA